MLTTSLAAAALALAADHSSANEPRMAGIGLDILAPLPFAQDYDDEYADDYAGARGGNGWYLSGLFGLVTTSNSDGPDEEIDFDEGFQVGGAIGTRFGGDDGNAWAFDTELEVLYNDQDADNEGVLEAVSDITVLAALINGVAEFALTERFALYGGAGIGMAGLDIGTESDAVNDFDEEDGPFLAWQAKAGVRLWASDDVAWSLGYRFINIDDAEIDDDLGGASFDLQTEQHVIELGVRFQL
jgi:opacity protein-like surface antigen